MEKAVRPQLEVFPCLKIFAIFLPFLVTIYAVTPRDRNRPMTRKVGETPNFLSSQRPERANNVVGTAIEKGYR